jgi:hypothetical protein
MSRKSVSQLLLVASAGVLMLTGLAVAQAGPGAHDPGHPRVNQVNHREQDQQNRIANGEKSGKLSAGQAANLEKREASLENQEKKDMSEHGGHLTKAEQRGLNQRENRISHSIYKDKH